MIPPRIVLNHLVKSGTTVRRFSQPVREEDIKKSVYISTSKDIYTNLALEDWLYRKTDFNKHHVLMLWQNEPCVVIGRHQNPWLEANLSQLANITDNGVNLARRDSGGGTVYHDLGNLNLTFFTPKERYSRKYNLEIITRALYRKFGLVLDISPREDLMFQGYKVSGTASKLGRPNAYHHCTLLVNANEDDLRQALHRPDIEIKTNATRSIKSKIANLSEGNPDLTVAKLMDAVGWEYMGTPALSSSTESKHSDEQMEFKMVDPTEAWYPEIGDIRARYASWDWVFGKTPKFEVSRRFAVPQSGTLGPGDVNVTVCVEQGRIRDVVIGYEGGGSEKVDGVGDLVGQKFSEEALACLDVGDGIDKDSFVVECVRKVIASV